ncbi:hypothetical protein MMC31_001666 [Peltigera leucophlebia]|nr:hypothetical protein [Peltigera leucophlebia]
MNLKLSALIICSALFSLSASLTQGQAADNEKLRAMLLALPAPTIAVTPVDRVYPDRDSKNINLPEKREQSELPPTQLYVCEQPRLKGRCEGLPSKRGFCWHRYTFSDDNCKDPILKDIEHPGIPDLGIPLPPNGVKYINDSIGSYSCV